MPTKGQPTRRGATDPKALVRAVADVLDGSVDSVRDAAIARRIPYDTLRDAVNAERARRKTVGA